MAWVAWVSVCKAMVEAYTCSWKPQPQRSGSLPWIDCTKKEMKQWRKLLLSAPVHLHIIPTYPNYSNLHVLSVLMGLPFAIGGKKHWLQLLSWKASLEAWGPDFIGGQDVTTVAWCYGSLKQTASDCIRLGVACVSMSGDKTLGWGSDAQGRSSAMSAIGICRLW